MTFIYTGLWILAVLIFTDWRQWKSYYPTLLFIAAVNLIEELLTAHYPLWRFTGPIPNMNNHTLTSLWILLLNLPLSIYLFLYRYPYDKGILRQVLWYLLFVAIYIGMEWIAGRNNFIHYSHGWSLGWSIILDIYLFLVMRAHHSRPPIAWGLVIIAFIFAVHHFHIPIHQIP